MLLAHDIAGTGEPVALLHSAVGDRRMFTPQWQPLTDDGHQVVRVDFRGYGDTPAPTGPHNHADDVRDVLDQHGLSRVSIVGSSFGGRVATEFAARWPSRVSRLVLVCAAGRGVSPTPDVEEFWELEDELIQAGKLQDATELNVRTWVGPSADDATRQQVAVMQLHAFEVQVAGPDVDALEVEYDPAAITARTLVVTGAHDLTFFERIGDHLAATIPGADRVHLDWAAHLPSLEDPARFNPLLLDFLRD